MAVWMQLFGKNELYSDPVDIHNYWDNILSSIELDLHFLKDTLDHRADEKKLRTDFYQYDKTYWQITVSEKEDDPSVHLLYPFYLADHATWDGIQILFYKDVIKVTGLFDHFQRWGTMTCDKNLREGYGKIVKNIFERFKSPCAIYASEWCILDEDGEFSFDDIYKACRSRPEHEAKELDGLKGMSISSRY